MVERGLKLLRRPWEEVNDGIRINWRFAESVRPGGLGALGPEALIMKETGRRAALTNTSPVSLVRV